MAARRIVGLKLPVETSAQFARRIGLPARTINAYRKGDTGASVEAVATVVQQAGVNPRWLLLGEEPKYDRPRTQPIGAEAQRKLVAAAEAADALAAHIRELAGLSDPHAVASSEAPENRRQDEADSSSEHSG